MISKKFLGKIFSFINWFMPGVHQWYHGFNVHNMVLATESSLTWVQWNISQTLFNVKSLFQLVHGMGDANEDFNDTKKEKPQYYEISKYHSGNKFLK